MTCLFLILKQLCSLNLLGLPRLEQHRDCEDFAPSISLSAGGQSHPPREDETRRWDQAPQLVSFRIGLAARGFSKNKTVLGDIHRFSRWIMNHDYIVDVQ